jgi:hypothetical protein
MVDSTKENTDDRYTITVSSFCPQGHRAQLRIIATEGQFVDTFEFYLIIGSYQYLVWNPDITPSSGLQIDSTLTALGFAGCYTISLPSEQLDLYRALFVCCGIYPNNFRIDTASAEATAIVNYLNNGGRVYLEGGEVWYYDPTTSGYNFGSLFGLNGATDGTGDLGPVVGQTGTFTQEMNFDYNGENSSIDHLFPTLGSIIFCDGDNGYNCGVIYNSGNYRTVGTSFELGSLTDGTGVSTKAVLLDSIMHFFGIFSSGIQEQNSIPEASRLTLKVYPNPVKNHAVILTQATNIRIYDVSGKLVRTLSAANPQLHITNNRFVWDGTNEHGSRLPAGVYFVNLNVENKRLIKPVVLIN